MPMFYTPKPRQFHYEPRFYDPEKEEWEKLKAKYALKKEVEAKTKKNDNIHTDNDLEYFERKVRDMDRQERQKSSRFSLRDIFRKREMPTFNYQPRFNTSGPEETANATDSTTASSVDAEGAAIMQRMRKRKLSRRFDMDDIDYFKPISGGKIIMYVIIVFILLLWILL